MAFHALTILIKILRCCSKNHDPQKTDKTRKYQKFSHINRFCETASTAFISQLHWTQQYLLVLTLEQYGEQNP